MTKSVYTPQYARLREILIQARQRAGWTQYDLAERLERPQSFVSKYERGERRLDLVEFLEVAEVLQVDVHEVIRELTEQRQ